MTTLSPDPIPSTLSLFSNFFKASVASHPKKTQLLTHLNSFVNFIFANQDDLSKGYQFLKDLKASFNQSSTPAAAAGLTSTPTPNQNSGVMPIPAPVIHSFNAISPHFETLSTSPINSQPFPKFGNSSTPPPPLVTQFGGSCTPPLVGPPLAGGGLGLFSEKMESEGFIGKNGDLSLIFRRFSESTVFFKYYPEFTEFDSFYELASQEKYKFFFENCLLGVSLRFLELLFLDGEKSLFPVMKERLGIEVLTNEKFGNFLQQVEQIRKNEGLTLAKSFVKLITNNKINEIVFSFLPLIKHLIMKYLITGDWNLLREKLLDRSNPNALNQIFSLFKSSGSGPLQDNELTLSEENTFNFMQIVALALNINIKFNHQNDRESKIEFKQFGEASNPNHNVTLFVAKNGGNPISYYILLKNEEINENKGFRKKSEGLIEEKEMVKKSFSNFLKANSLKIDGGVNFGKQLLDEAIITNVINILFLFHFLEKSALFQVNIFVGFLSCF